MIPLFKAHPTLLSLRASFKPKAVAGEDFVSAVPASLKTLGFINIDSVDNLAVLFERCALEHFWFEATSVFGGCVWRAGVLERLATMKSSFQHLRTLSFPSSMREEHCAALCALCPKVELICRMRLGSPEFGTQALQSHFEPVPDSGGVALRRRGTNAALTASGSLWAPYEQDDCEVMALCKTRLAKRPRVCSSPSRFSVSRSKEPLSFEAFASELAVAAASRHR